MTKEKTGNGDQGSAAKGERVGAKPAIIGIGASAGGIQALKAFFESLPEKIGAAFVVVVHLDPESHSDLSSILAGWTPMPVLQVNQQEKLEADRVYVIPPGRRLHITDHEISAATFDEPRGRRAPIDLFFRSLAENGDGFAIILTGAGSDGAIGVRAVKEAGGIILVQDPEEAEYASMPRSAIATGVADFVLPVRDLAARLFDLVRTRANLSTGTAQVINEELLHRILANLRVRTGHDFFKYKRSTVLRRIGRRMQVTRSDDLESYYDHLRDNTDEAQALLGDLLISVTTFFRDREVFEAIATHVMTKLCDGKEAGEAARVWVPGCATGEEAYSIAMLMLEEAARREIRPSIQVFGSDLDESALNVARDGRYPSAIEADVSESRLQRFFVREGNGYQVRQDLRDMMLFAGHDLLKDPPFSRVDFVSCRNLLIYLDRELQEQVIGTFHYALNPGGHLLLGPSETAEEPQGLFHSIDRVARIYQSTARPGEKPRLLPRLLGGMGVHDQGAHVARPLSPRAALGEAVSHRKAIEKLAPPSIVVDHSHKVVHLSENAGRYMQPSGGLLSGDVVDLARPEFRFELRTALHRAFERLLPTLSLPIEVSFNGAPRRVHMLVKPAIKDDSEPGSKAVVMFIEGDAVEDHYEPSDGKDATDGTVSRLTRELELTQSRLRTTREESEGANEELRAANEELQSINEEYRSTSEELETSKEELQSINEELQTVNSELKLKLETIARAHSDLQNLMAATDFGTVFLDSNLRIKLFTDRVTGLFSFTSADEGRPILDFAHQLEYDELAKDTRTVLSHLTPLQREVRSRDGHWYEVRLRPYKTVDGRIDGIVVTFIDITERREIEDALRRSESRLQQDSRLIELSHDAIFVWDFDGGIVEWNRGSEELYGYAREEVLGKNKAKLLQTDVPGSSFAQLMAELKERGSWTGQLRHRTKDGRTLVVDSRLQFETFDDRRLVLESTHDITERKLWEKRQHLLLSELSHRVKNILSVVQAIAHQSLSVAGDRKEDLGRFDGRLSALAHTHSLLTESNWAGADVAELAHQQLEPYVAAGPDRVEIKGEPISLPAELATPFGLVFHELATNAAKYGSLSSKSGKVDLSWTVRSRNQRRWLRVTWVETGGPPVKRPVKTGLGTKLIESVIPDSTARREFRRAGLVCTIEAPLIERDSFDAVPTI